MALCDLEPKKKAQQSSQSRSAMRRRLQRRNRRVDNLECENDKLWQTCQELEKRLSDITSKLENARAEIARQSFVERNSSEPSVQRERPLPGHQFCLTSIALSIELGKRVGFRAAADVMQTVFDMLKINMKVPSHDAIQQWTHRLGVASLKSPFRNGERVLWMVDHSSQIGKERLLLIVGVALDDLPPPGQTLTFEKMKVLAVVPGQSWKKEDVEREYLKLAHLIGAPVYLLSDGASELREPAQKLEKDGQPTIVLGDLKHHAANVLEKEVGRCPRFQSFMSQVGLTRNRVQQTELDQFSPPTLRTKSRFMNLAPLFTWSMMALYHLNTPGSNSRIGISVERMEAKLGWLREHADDLVRWNHCQEVIDRSLSVINRQGLDGRTGTLVNQSLREQNPNWRNENSSAARIGVQLIDWIEKSSSQLKAGERAWLSTEILESLFGRFKQMERQHSKGGFTRLIAALPTLCLRVTPTTVREAFLRVDCKETQNWIQTSLGSTLTARRNAAYRESKAKIANHVVSKA